VSAPGGSHVYAQFAAERTSRAAAWSSRSVRSSPSSRPFAEERAEALLVAPPLGEELVRALALEVPPLTDEDGRDVQLLRDNAQMRPQSQPDPSKHRQVVGDLVERRVERRGALPHRLVEQVLLGLDVRVERALLNPERLRQVADRRAVVATLGEEPRSLAG